MRTINLSEAAGSLEALITALETGQAREIIITRDERPVAKLVPVKAAAQKVRFGVAKGKFHIPDEWL